MTAQELKNSILQLAVQGKLVEQRPEEGTAKKLIAQIKAERELLVKVKMSKREKELPEIKEEEIPFEIPESWEWVRLVELAKTNDTESFTDGPFGSNLKREHQINAPEVRIIQLSNIGENGWKDENVKYTSFSHLKTIARCEVHAGDFIIAKMMPAGRTIILPELNTKACLGSDAIRFVPTDLVDRKYLLYAMKSKVFLNQIYNEMHGITRMRTSLGKLKTYILPLPPLAEQKRIVVKIEEILPYIEQYNKAYSKLNTLDKKFTDDLRKSFLQSAVQGKLVEQRSEEGTAEELCQQIVTEKAKLVKEGKIRKEKPLPRITESEIPFEIPESWEWLRMGDCISLLSGQDMPPDKYNSEHLGIPYLTGASNIQDGDVIINRWTEKPKAIAFQGNLLITCKGTVGTTCILKEKQVHIARQIMAITHFVINADYVHLFMQYYVDALRKRAKGMIPGIERKDVLEALFPIPPLSEQKRIVARLEHLLSYCEQLKNDISKGISL